MSLNAAPPQRQSNPNTYTLLSELQGKRYLDLEKETQFNDAWFILGFVLLLLGTFLNLPFLAATGLMLFVIIGISRLWNQLGLFGVHYYRYFSETRAFVGETVELTLEVSNQKFIPVPWLYIVDIVPDNLNLTIKNEAKASSNLKELPTFWALGPFQRLSRQFTIQCTQRGYYTYGPAHLQTGDLFGLFDRKGTLTTNNHLIIYPRLYSVVDLKLPAKNPFGIRRSTYRLFEDPLRTKGIREWQPSDNPGRIHWKATARHQQLLSRVYEPSEEAQLILFLNVATLPKYWQGYHPKLLERTISVAASLAALAIEQRLPVGLLANGVYPHSDQSLRLLPGRSPNQLTHILEMLAIVTSVANQSIEKHLLQQAPSLPWGTTLIIISAVTYPALLAALLDLHQAGRKIILFTLAPQPPEPLPELAGILTYHLPHLIDDLIAPEELII